MALFQSSRLCRVNTATKLWLRHGRAFTKGPTHVRGLKHLIPSSTQNGTPARDTCNLGWLDEELCIQASRDYDAVMVLGGGLTPEGGFPEWVHRRLDAALHLYRKQRKSCPILLLGAGTPHKPPVMDETGFVLHESTVYAQYLLQQGVPVLDLLKEGQSYDTVGNGYFSLVIHALPAGWRNIAVVTSEFHMPRTQAIFDFCYTLAGGQYFNDPCHFTVDFFPASDRGIFDPAVVEARLEKELAAVRTWQQNSSKLASMQDLHSWLFSTHLCYSVSRQHEFGREQDLDPRLLATY